MLITEYTKLNKNRDRELLGNVSGRENLGMDPYKAKPRH